MKIAICAPCHIPPTKDWIYALEREAKLGNADVFIIDDSDGKLGELPSNWRVYDYAKQKEFLGELYEDFATMFHKCSACRIFGHLVAYKENYDVIIGLDSDCVVPFFFVQSHLSILNTKKAYGWSNPLGGSGWFTRGYPYSMRDWRIIANMGMWDNVLDLNGKDRQKDEPKRINVVGSTIAPAPLPFSGMNFSMLREAIPGFLFLPNFKYQNNDFRRIDDVWGGYIFQSLMRKRREAVVYGQPIVFHDTIVVPAEDAAEEEAMYKWEDNFINTVDHAMNFNTMVAPQFMPYFDLFSLFVNELKKQPSIFEALIPAMDWWLKALKPK